MLLLPSCLLGLVAGSSWHAPHDPAYSIASTLMPDGRILAVTVGNEGTVIFSFDRGLSWNMLTGAGLETENPWEVTFHPGMPSAGGIGLFVIGTDRGAFTWDPVADLVLARSGGLPTDDRQILDLDSPLAGSDGPTIALTMKGNVYLLWPQATDWTLSHSLPSGLPFLRGAVAIAPHYDHASTTLGGRDLYAAGGGLLYLSRDGGGSWTLHPRFTLPAAGATDWMIATLALSESYLQDGTMMLGRARLDPAAGHDVGEIWRSTNWGSTFSRIQNVPSGVLSLLATPAGPGGVRTWLATTRAYPNTGSVPGIGVLISTDAGASWDDHGNDQDFLMENNPGHASGDLRMNYEQQIAVLPDYATRGEVWYGRQEGLFVSCDQGLHWEQRQIRVEREFRDLEVTRMPSGLIGVFGAGYGVGTVLHLPQLGTVEGLPAEPPMIYQRRLSLSPRFEQDGNMIVAGNIALWCWQEPTVAPANPSLASLWWMPDNTDPVSGESLTGWPRIVVYSPNFDGRGLPGTDQTIFWSGWDFGPYRSEDNGVTAKALHGIAGGGTMDEASCFAIAPTYDAAGARTDAYSADYDGRVFRLENEEWVLLTDLGTKVEDLVCAPDWSRPANPRLFAALASHPYVVELVDQPSGLQTILRLDGLPRANVAGLACHPNFATTPILYAATFGAGVWRMDLAAPAPIWEPVGVGFPRLWCRDVALSPDFATDPRLFVATQEGIWTCRDLAGSVWSSLTFTGTRDETDESFQYFQPTNPANPHPDHAWPWVETKRWSLPIPLDIFGESVRHTSFDGSYATTIADCASLSVLTVAGPQLGTMRIEVTDFLDGTPVTTHTVDLATLATSAECLRVNLSLPGGKRQVRVTVHADLDPGELLVLDGIEFTD